MLVRSDQKLQIYSLLYDFDFVETVLCNIHASYATSRAVLALADYLEWVLTESQVRVYI